MKTIPKTPNPPGKNGCHRGGAPSSFAIQDWRKVFTALALQDFDILADLGCGRGEYSLYAAKILNPMGLVYALDSQARYIEDLKKRAMSEGTANLIALCADIRSPLPLLDGSATICLLATLLHATGLKLVDERLGSELQRILRPKGRVAVLEVKKEEQPFGPPLERRLAPHQVESSFVAAGFTPLSYTDLGFTYLVQLEKDG